MLCNDSFSYHNIFSSIKSRKPTKHYSTYLPIEKRIDEYENGVVKNSYEIKQGSIEGMIDEKMKSSTFCYINSKIISTG